MLCVSLEWSTADVLKDLGIEANFDAICIDGNVIIWSKIVENVLMAYDVSKKEHLGGVTGLSVAEVEMAITNQCCPVRDMFICKLLELVLTCKDESDVESENETLMWSNIEPELRWNGKGISYDSSETFELFCQSIIRQAAAVCNSEC